MEYDWSMNDRIKEIRLLLRKKQGELAQILAIKQSSLSDIENRRVKVSDRVIKDMVIGVNASEEYIRYGTGEPISKTPSSTMEQLKKEFNLDDFEYSLVYEYLKLSPEHRKVFRDYFYRVIAVDTVIDDNKTKTDTSITTFKTTEETEKEYIKSRFRAVQKERLSASNITGENGNINKTNKKNIV